MPPSRGRVPTVDEVAADIAAGASVAEIADRCGCTARTVRNVARRGQLDLRPGRPGPRRRPSGDPAQPSRRPASPRYPVLYEPGWLAGQLPHRRPLAAIAAEVGCSTATVRRAVGALGIVERRRHGEVRFPQLHDPTWLRRRYLDDGASSTVLAADIGCRPATVLRALHRDGIDRRLGRPPRRFPHLHDPAWLRRRYLDDGLPARQLSADIGGSTGSVRRALRRHNIPTRGAQRHPQLADPAWLTRRYITDSATIADLAADIGCSPGARAQSPRPRQPLTPSPPDTTTVGGTTNDDAGRRS